VVNWGRYLETAVASDVVGADWTILSVDCERRCDITIIIIIITMTTDSSQSINTPVVVVPTPAARSVSHTCQTRQVLGTQHRATGATVRLQELRGYHVSLLSNITAKCCRPLQLYQ